MSKPTVLITGATGKQGGNTVSSLLDGGKVSIRALVRNPESETSQALASKGVELKKGDLTDVSSIAEALKGVQSALLVTTPAWGEGGDPDLELKQGKAFLEAAKQVGLKNIVFTSVEGAERNSGVPHFDIKYEVEKLIDQAGFENKTILRPVAFYENWPVKAADLPGSLAAFETFLQGKAVQLVATRDIGWFAARALEDPAKWNGKIVKIAGDELSAPQALDVYAKVFGIEKPELKPVPKEYLPEELKIMFQWFVDKGYEADVAETKKEYPGVQDFETWLRENKQ